MSYRRPGGAPPPSVPISRGPKVIKTVGGGGGGGTGGTGGTKSGGCSSVIALPVVLGLALAVGMVACRPHHPTHSPRPIQSGRQATP